MRYKVTLLALFISSFIAAQTPGYMGRHCMIGYSNNFFVSALGANTKSTEVGINSTHCFNFEYVIKNRTNFCLSFQTLKTGLEPDESYDYSNYGNAEYDPKPYVPMQVRSTNIALGFKFFRKGTFAPVGKYRKIEMMLLLSKLNYEKNSFTYYDYNSSSTIRTSLGKGEYNFSSFAIAYTFGRQRVLFDRLVLDYGIQVAVFPGIVLNTLGDGLFELGSSTGNIMEYDLQRSTSMRLFTHQLFNFHIGLGFLAF